MFQVFADTQHGHIDTHFVSIVSRQFRVLSELPVNTLVKQEFPSDKSLESLLYATTSIANNFRRYLLRRCSFKPNFGHKLLRWTPAVLRGTTDVNVDNF